MKDPFEYIARDYLPWMKGLISVDLSSKGYSQSSISALIGVTQPSINYYLKKERRDYIQKLESIGLSEPTISDQEKRLIQALETGSSEGTAMLIRAVVDALVSGDLCDYHRRVYRAPDDCDACMKLWGTGTTGERSQILQELSSAVELLEGSELFAHLIPEVRSNFVYSAKDPKGPNDVAGVVGRIVKLKGRPRAMSKPEFGASRHLAGVLLTVNARYSAIRSAINVKYDSRVRRCMDELGWSVAPVKLDAFGEGDVVVSSVARAIKETTSRPDALVQEGDLGLEPASYIFGGDPFEVSGKAVQLAAAYVRSRENTPALTQ